MNRLRKRKRTEEWYNIISKSHASIISTASHDNQLLFTSDVTLTQDDFKKWKSIQDMIIISNIDEQFLLQVSTSPQTLPTIVPKQITQTDFGLGPAAGTVLKEILSQVLKYFPQFNEQDIDLVQHGMVIKLSIKIPNLTIKQMNDFITMTNTAINVDTTSSILKITIIINI
jgi:hypothetical protein